MPHDSLQLLAPWPGMDTSANMMSLSSNSRAILSQELKMLRLRISDYNKSPVIDAICQKVIFTLLLTFVSVDMEVDYCALV